MSQPVEKALELADIAQHAWSEVVARRRLNKIGKVGNQIAQDFQTYLPAIQRPSSSDADKLASEILPLAAACHYTAQIGRRTLAPQYMPFRHAAWWMGRVSVRVTREPWGTVLILAPNNYPLLLPGVQIIQAIAAGNAVVVKPAPDCGPVMEAFKLTLGRAGIPEDLLQILPSTIEAGQEAMRHGVDKVILTGSFHSGRAVLRELAETLTPATMELSGCDAMFVLPNADVAIAVKSFLFALELNGGATCIAPRRVFLLRESAVSFIEELKQKYSERSEPKSFPVPIGPLTATIRCIEQALAKGAEIIVGEMPQASDKAMSPVILRGVDPTMEIARADLFAPVSSIFEFDDMSAALAADRKCPYSLGASVFGPQSYAEHWAEQVAAGCVVVNDAVVPTADPRAPFGGWDQSGWGVTRGKEGLLEMTRVKTICTRHGKWLPHLDPRLAQDTHALGQILQLFYGSGLKTRWRALVQLIATLRK
ncbi:MAG: aldehyde dehydrogenase family protein [Pirellulaceae bacterium]